MKIYIEKRDGCICHLIETNMRAAGVYIGNVED